MRAAQKDQNNRLAPSYLPARYLYRCYWQTMRIRPVADFSLRHERGWEGSERMKGGFTFGFQPCTAVPESLTEAEATAGRDFRSTGAGGISCGTGAAYVGCGAAAKPGKVKGFASTTEPSDVRVQPATRQRHAAAMRNRRDPVTLPVGRPRLGLLAFIISRRLCTKLGEISAALQIGANRRASYASIPHTR
jgi:hypothetical protein